MPESKSGDAPFRRGHVIWHDGLFRTSGRPWLVVSDGRHPFHGEEYIVAGLTTTQRSDALRLSESDWEVGGLPRTTHVSPWFLTTLKHSDVDRGVGQIATEPVTEILNQINCYVQ